jgi:hypothetical protein
MALVIDHLTDFQQKVLRNTPALRLKSQVFNPMIHTIGAMLKQRLKR